MEIFVTALDLILTDSLNRTTRHRRGVAPSVEGQNFASLHWARSQLANSAECHMVQLKIVAPLIRIEDQTARPLIQRQFGPQGVKHNPQYQIVDCVASVKQDVLSAQQR